MAKRIGVQRLSRHKKKYWRKGTLFQDALPVLSTGVEIPPELVPVGSDAPLEKTSSGKKGSKKRKATGVDLQSLATFKNLLPDPSTRPAQVDTFKRRGKGSADWKAKIAQWKSKKPAPQPEPKRLGEKVKAKAWRGKKAPSGAEDVVTELNVSDVWGGEKQQQTELPPELEDYYLRQTKKKGVNVPKTKFVPTSILPKVEVAHPGASYNPSLVDHQQLLSVAHKAERKELSEQQKWAKKCKSTEPMATVEIQEKELEEGLFEADRGSEDEEDREDAGGAAEFQAVAAPTVSDNRKRKSLRRREKEQKLLQQKRAEEKDKRKRESEVFLVPSIKKQLREQEKKLVEIQKKREEKKKMKLARPLLLSRFRFEPPKVELKLTEELEGSLRLLKPEGNIMEDRFKSLQKRNIIETRVKQQKKRRYKKKVIEKRSHKESGLLNVVSS